jgi:hypothetical protein
MDGTSVEDPGARWMRHMRRGEWEEAWRLSDAALAARKGVVDWQAPRHLQHIWDGSPLAGRRVLVRCYHGLGDTLQFIRYVPLLERIAAEVTVWAQPALIPLLRTLGSTPRLLPLHDGTPEAEYEVDLEIMELAHAFRSTPATLPASVPYLHPPPRPLPPSEGLKVGLVWRAGDWDTGRSIPTPLLEPLSRIPGIALHLLQRGPALAEAPPGLGTSSGSDDVLEAAGRMLSLDLVLSVDSMPAHLAGALGVPVWTLLRHEADWRWMEGRDTSPWYPSMRLIRQQRPGDWEGVVQQVRKGLVAIAQR